MNTQEVILVTENDEEIGAVDKMKAHADGLLHRAFSIFIFDRKGRLLLQQRSGEKYHGAWLWTNTCCSHPYPGEQTEAAAQRRLQEEMGFSTPLLKLFEFKYRADVENNLIEHEYDHVFIGSYEGEVNINKSEVADYCYKEMDNMRSELNEQPGKFTAWFKIAFPKIEAWWCEQYGKRI